MPIRVLSKRVLCMYTIILYTCNMFCTCTNKLFAYKNFDTLAKLFCARIKYCVRVQKALY